MKFRDNTFKQILKNCLKSIFHQNEETVGTGSQIVYEFSQLLIKSLTGFFRNIFFTFRGVFDQLCVEEFCAIKICLFKVVFFSSNRLRSVI